MTEAWVLIQFILQKGDKMSTKAEKAREYFKEGYNCCQAVVLAFCEDVNIDKETALLIASSFGGGIGRLREVCGAVSGMCIIAGLKNGYISPKAKDEKANHYKLIQTLAKEFEKKNGSIICRELTGLNKDTHIPDERNKEYYKKRPCDALVYDAAEILEKYMK